MPSVTGPERDCSPTHDACRATSTSPGRKYNRTDAGTIPPVGIHCDTSAEDSAMNRAVTRILLLTLFVAAALIGPTIVHAVEPALGNIVPSGIQRGVESEVQ